MGNSVRDQIKDTIRECLETKCYAVSDSGNVYEDACTIADSIFDALFIKERSRKMKVDYKEIDKAKEILRDNGCIADIWSIEDVKEQSIDRNMNLTDEQALEVLNECIECYDSEQGINWYTIDAILDIMQLTKEPTP